MIARARDDCWKGTDIAPWRATQKIGSRRWIARVQRSGEKSRGNFSPTGKLSSDRRGCSRRSTSSMMRRPESANMLTTLARARTSRSMDGWCLRRVSRSTSSFSRRRSWTLFTEVAVHSTTPRCATADRILSTIRHDTADARSKLRVKTRLRMMEEKADRSVAFVCSRSAGGIICTTRDLPSPSMRLRMGEMTVVLPPPMSICFTRGSPPRTLRTNSSTSSTCAFLSRMLWMNSNRSSRGS
mmetsp:Transcript_17877/g.52095  ORF Transcript_17877/g.52095 Transcript_17877/m.52095 type:complete len:241 (+) Transcript_17877:1081-1803(+)